ncbi:MAG: secretin N-terminal domain-containing protein [Candidatus Omnitrophica bacterium]|nr:secretin N-terminal domain-containing protein [Candidatus Omnitrophota bacterium]
MRAKKIFVVAGVLFICFTAVLAAFAVETAKMYDINGHAVTGPVYDKDAVVSLDFENADLKNVLKAFSMQTGINFIASDIIEDKKITVFLSGVSVESALLSMLEANGLLYEKQPGNVYMIKPTGKGNIKTMTRVFRMNYLQVYKMAEAIGATGTTSNITIIGQPAIAQAGSVSSSTANSAATGGQTGGGDGQAKNIIDIIRSLMSKYGSIIADRRSNSLIITDIPDVFETIEEVVKKLDIEPIQIVIQAEIIETTTSGLKRIGAEYGSETQLFKATYTGASDTTAGATNSESPTFPTPFPFTQSFLKNTYGATLANSPFSYGTLTIDDMDFVLKLLAQDSDTKYLSRPKIMTINNEPAIIKVSANTAIGTNNTSVSQTAQNITTAERAETGIILKVTPQVNDNGDIFMFIEPSVSRAVPSTLSASFYDPSYRSAASTVMVRDMDTVVVAGLIETNNFKTTRKIPFLGDIPLIGEAFKSKYNKTEDTELLMFITPRVIKKRDAEIITPPNMSDRGYMIDKTLAQYTEKVPEQDDLKRDAEITKALKKYPALTGKPKKK